MRRYTITQIDAKLAIILEKIALLGQFLERNKT